MPEIARCHRLVRGLVEEHVRPWQLSAVEFSALWLCERAPPPGPAQTDLAGAIGVSAAQISGVVERLRQRGWLVFQRGEPDRRRQFWQLTTAGSGVLQQIKLGLGQCSQHLDRRLSPRDSRFLGELLRRLAQAVEERTAVSEPDTQGAHSPTRKEAQHETWRRAV